MVVLAAAVLTKSGKTLISRQFVELSKVRIEGLLAAFPKLVGTGKQHTFVETDAVRYVYQPMENLYIVLISNKSSNILDDLETLHLMAKTIPEYCPVLEEAELIKKAFDVICCLDEMISSGGYKERVTISQIKHYISMESHEEERARIEEKMKELEAKKEAERVRKRLDKKRSEERRLMGEHGLGPMSGGGGRPGSSGSGMGGGGGGMGSDSHYDQQPYIEKRPEPQAAAPKDARPSKGMNLMVKQKKSAVAQVLREEKMAETEEEAEQIMDAKPGQPPAPVIPTEAVHVTIEEQIVVQVDHDGGVENLEVKGGLLLTVSDANIQRPRLVLNQGDNKNFQFKTHPNVDRAAFGENELRLREGSRAFPAGSPAPLLKWRIQSKDEALLPISINCWPSPANDGHTYVNMEYECNFGELTNVSVSIPVPGAPVVTSVEGHYEYQAGHGRLLWKLAVIDDSNRAGSMEFSVPRANAEAFFPLQVSFQSSKTFCDIRVAEVTAEDDRQIKFSQVTSLAVENYTIV